ncbi:hypothetical protein G5B30_03425 [Sphingobacterium sp. SGG-5]|uniref:hypothetical protein n=1 Tax=Sphingobacterium sp. SGG-5 TaxID=2710881 RepID=UPI0013EDC2D2|nr:hypothetical protein [Sphingobacterium sp. SGG-5]NGM60962.1 hypothetical protein [Sphingobacterium sp. SGG-5]
MKKKYLGLAIILFLLASVATAQQKLADGTDGDGISANTDAILELSSANKGLLHSRIKLTQTSDAAPLSAHVAGMTVYNTATAGSGATAVTPGYYYNDGTQWVRIASINDLPELTNIYNADGTLTTDRTVTLDGNQLTILGKNQETFWSLHSGIVQRALDTSPYQEASMSFIAPDKDGDGDESVLSIQAYSESSAQIYAGRDAADLTIGTHATTTSAPILFNTSSGNGALATEKARITGEGNMGIGINDPTEKLDVGDGNLRVRDIGSLTGTVTDKVVVADADGVLKTLKAAMPKFFYMPSLMVPISEAQLNAANSGKLAGDSFDDGTHTGVITLYGRYNIQFGSTRPSSPSAPLLPVLPSSELHYYVTWYDPTVFTSVSIDSDGLMTYVVAAGVDVTERSFMNIVFAVKEDNE